RHAHLDDDDQHDACGSLADALSRLMRMGAPVTVFDTPEQLGWTLAGEILDRTRAALRRRRRFLLGCPSGRTPRVIYQALARRAAGPTNTPPPLISVMRTNYGTPAGRGGFAPSPTTPHHRSPGSPSGETRPATTRDRPPAPSFPPPKIGFPDPADPAEYDAR